MKHEIFTVYDQKAKAYLPPFILPEIGMAVRVFKDCVNSDKHQFSKHPEDYTLFNLGQFDDSNGLIETMNPQTIHNGVELKDQYNGEADPVSNDPPILTSAEG